ncbi:hypothetical protein J4Q44_G00179380 [Coregonus suidteri]|uniref:Uncharacterized protein n=1 Tax=Coregonus suidteri TaxID=861788 RepID=A0AAN8QQD7_9TELE
MDRESLGLLLSSNRHRKLAPIATVHSHCFLLLDRQRDIKALKASYVSLLSVSCHQTDEQPLPTISLTSFISTKTGILTRRHTKDSVTAAIFLLPDLFNEDPRGLYIMDKISPSLQR